MIKVIIFDLDGVLVDSCDLHFNAFNKALEISGNSDKQITYDEHLEKYNGKPTIIKLNMLTNEKGLDHTSYDHIWKLKQKITNEMIELYTPDERIIDILHKLKQNGYILYCASNSIWKTLKTILLKRGFLDYIDFFISNEDVKYPKPHPEIYYKCLQRANVSPNEILIIEDSDIGLKAATASGAHVLKISNTYDLIYNKIISYINDIYPKPPLNIVIPMAGLGSRFSEAGYKLPKPLITINNKKMIELVVENLQFTHDKTRFIFITREEHRQLYNLDTFLSSIAPGCSIISIDKTTEGAACTVLLAKDLINNSDNLIIANSDQFLEWNPTHFLQTARDTNTDCVISIFNSTHPKWSYAKEENGVVIEVAEKTPISDMASTGIYFWKHGSDFVQCAEKMIEKNIRVNNEFYVCPVFNEAILQNKKIITSKCEKMWGLGTPEDLMYFLENYKCFI